MAQDPYGTLWSGIKHFEAGGRPYKKKWDYKLYTWGFGTPWRPGMTYDYATAESEMKRHAMNKMQQVVQRFPHLAKPENHNRLLALTDLTYNSGSKWFNAGLGRAVARNDWEDARRRFLQYDKVQEKNGRFRSLPGLTKRRRWGADLMVSKPNVDPTTYGGAATTVLAGGGGEYLPDEAGRPQLTGMMSLGGAVPPTPEQKQPMPLPEQGSLSLPTVELLQAEPRAKGSNINGGMGVSPTGTAGITSPMQISAPQSAPAPGPKPSMTPAPSPQPTTRVGVGAPGGGGEWANRMQQQMQGGLNFGPNSLYHGNMPARQTPQYKSSLIGLLGGLF